MNGETGRSANSRFSGSGDSGAFRSGMSRREFLGGSFKAGISITALGAFLSSCGITGSNQAGGDQGDGDGEGGGNPPISIAINDSPWFPSFEEIVKIYQEETGNSANLQVFTFEGLLTKTLNAANSKSGEFDIYNLNEGWCAEFYNGGLVTPFEEIDSGFSLDDAVIEYDSVTRWDQDAGYFSESAPVYGVPINGNIQLLFYRQDLYDEMGLKPPTTWEEAIEAAKMAGEQYENVYGYAMRGQAAGYAVTYDYLALLRSFEGDIFANPPDDYTVTINNEAGQKATDLFVELLSYGPKQPQNIGQAELIALMQSGELLQTHLASAAWANMDDEAASSVVGKVNYGVVPKTSDGVHAPTSGIWTMGIPTHLEDGKKKAAYDFLTWLMTKDAQMKYAQANGVITRQDVYESELADKEKYRYMKATADSTPYIHRGADYSFSAELLEITERRLEAIAGGLIKPKEGLDEMANEITKLVKEAGVPTG